MMRRGAALTAVVLIIVLLAAACAPKAPDPVPEAQQLLLTLEDLKQYDGQNGRPAYVAIGGVIYDLSNVSTWPGGRHQGNTAGKDLTDVLKNQSPHGTRVLSNLRVVGKLK